MSMSTASSKSEEWEIMSKTFITRAAAEATKGGQDEVNKTLWTLFAMTGIPSLIAGFGRIYRVKNLRTGARKNVFSSNDYTVGAKIAAVDWEFEMK
jgi:hypothetical protein